jgi:hypothetical protein
MWARYLEIALGVWLATAPFVLGTARDHALNFVELVAGAGVVVLAAASIRSRGRAHLGSPVIADVVASGGWWASRVAADARAENAIVVGLVLAMSAIVPTEASRPPVRWRQHAKARARVPERTPSVDPEITLPTSRGSRSSG